jgi:hypothetical protein
MHMANHTMHAQGIHGLSRQTQIRSVKLSARGQGTQLGQNTHAIGQVIQVLGGFEVRVHHSINSFLFRGACPFDMIIVPQFGLFVNPFLKLFFARGGWGRVAPSPWGISQPA